MFWPPHPAALSTSMDGRGPPRLANPLPLQSGLTWDQDREQTTHPGSHRLKLFICPVPFLLFFGAQLVGLAYATAVAGWSCQALSLFLSLMLRTHIFPWVDANSHRSPGLCVRNGDLVRRWSAPSINAACRTGARHRAVTLEDITLGDSKGCTTYSARSTARRTVFRGSTDTSSMVTLPGAVRTH